MAGLYPEINDDYVNLLEKICANSASIADAEAGDVASVTGTAGNVLVNGLTTPQTGAVVLSLPTAITSVNSITAAAATGLSLNAGTGNQNITVTPSGTGNGVVSLGGGGGLLLQDTRTVAANNAVSLLFKEATAASRIKGAIFFENLTGDGDGRGRFIFASNNTADSSNVTTANARVVISQAGNLLLGGLTTDGTGVLQFPAATTSAGGIAFGTTLGLYAGGVDTLALSHATDASFDIRLANTSKLLLEAFGTNSYVTARAGQALVLGSGNATAITIDTSQVATFAARIKLITGSAASPSLLLNGGSVNSGIYYIATDGLGIATNGTAAITITSAQATTVTSLAGTGSRAVLADANGLLSAPVSDETWKENLRALPDAMGLETVMALRPLLFNYRDKSRFGVQDYIGFGARETSKILPQVTGQDRDGTYYLSDEKITAVLVKAVQQQQAEINDLRAHLRAIENN